MHRKTKKILTTKLSKKNEERDGFVRCLPRHTLIGLSSFRAHSLLFAQSFVLNPLLVSGDIVNICQSNRSSKLLQIKFESTVKLR